MISVHGRRRVRRATSTPASRFSDIAPAAPSARRALVRVARGSSGIASRPRAMGDHVRYLAFLLDDLSRCSLLDWVRELGGEGANCLAGRVRGPLHDRARAHPRAARELPVGRRVRDARPRRRRGRAREPVHVLVQDFVPAPAAAVPHVTVRVAPDQSSARVSDDVLADALATGAYMATAEAAPLVLTGRLGGVTASDERVFLPPTAGGSEDPEEETEGETEAERAAVRDDGAAPRGGASNRNRLVAGAPSSLVAGRSSSADGRRAWLGAGAPGGFETAATRLRTRGGPPRRPDPRGAESYAAEAVRHLGASGNSCASFPNVPAATLKDALDACGGDLDAAAVRLMEGAAEGSGSGAAEGGAERPSTFAAAAAETVAAGSFRAGWDFRGADASLELERPGAEPARVFGGRVFGRHVAARRRQRDASAASARGSGALADPRPAEALRLLRRRHEGGGGALPGPGRSSPRSRARGVRARRRRDGAAVIAEGEGGGGAGRGWRARPRRARRRGSTTTTSAETRATIRISHSARRSFARWWGDAGRGPARAERGGGCAHDARGARVRHHDLGHVLRVLGDQMVGDGALILSKPVFGGGASPPYARERGVRPVRVPLGWKVGGGAGEGRGRVQVLGRGEEKARVDEQVRDRAAQVEDNGLRLNFFLQCVVA